MTQAWQLTSTRTIDLGWEQMLVLQGRPGTRVKILFGDAWLTEYGSESDHFPRTGEEVTLTTFGPTVIEPLGPTCISITEPAKAAGWRGLVASLHARARAVIARFPGGQPESA